MLTVQDAVQTEAIQEYVNQQLAARMVKELGYQWSDERIERIAGAIPEFFAVSQNIAWSLSEAIHEELVMYGDGSINNSVGVLNVR